MNILKDKNCRKYKSRLPRYSLFSILLRFIVSAILALVIMYFPRELSAVTKSKPEITDYLIAIFSFFILIEFNILIDILLNKLFPVPRKIVLRFAIQLTCGLTAMYIVSRLIRSLDRYSHHFVQPGMQISTLLGLFIIILIAMAFIFGRILEEYLFLQKEMEDLRAEKLKNDYNALQDQLNPHYLFNNLSVLKSLIRYDQKAAMKFTQNFTDVYRYVLKSKDKMTISLKDEIVFIEAYIGLHKERLGEGLQVKFNIDKNSILREIPPLTLQLLIENAIKHNIASEASPLKIWVKATKDYLVVKNILQLKKSSYSTKTGLNNLISRYKMLTEQAVEVSKSEKKFIVNVPLL